MKPFAAWLFIITTIFEMIQILTISIQISFIISISQQNTRAIKMIILKDIFRKNF